MSSQLNLLVVDDDKDVCEYLEDFLTQDGYNVTTLNDPTQVVETLKAGDYHVCIVDLMMPKMSGIDLLGADPQAGRRRRRHHPHRLPVARDGDGVDRARRLGVHQEALHRRRVPRRHRAHRARRRASSLRKEDELHQTIGRNIRELRKARSLTLKQMARRTKLSVSLLSQIERAESSASVSSLFKVASALDVRITQLFGDF